MAWLQMAVLTLATAGGGDVALLDFQADWCGPCRQMAPTIDELAARGYPIRKVNVDRDRALAERYKVQALPCFIMVAGGREIDRVEGATSYGRLAQMFKTAEAELGKSRESQASATMPNRMPSPLSPSAAIPPEASGPLFTAGASEPASDSQPVGEALSKEKPSSAGWTPRTGQGPPVANTRLIAASVRLRVEDPKGHSCGTGTIIDARQGWALILTCGHVFRDSNGKGRIEVDLFGEGGPHRVEAELVSYNLDRDVGLLKIRAPGNVAVAPVAPAGYALSEGQPVASVGCNNGADPTVEQTRIRSRNQFAGPPNVEADGLPIEGRSGGGLFTPDGMVVGVCNCADPTDNQGLYAALASIQQELDQAGLSYVYQSPEGVTPGAGAEPRSTAGGGLVAVAPPTMPEHMPNEPEVNSRGPAPLRPTAARSLAEPGSAPTNGLSAEERAALEEIQRRRAAGYEVVCIIRSRTDPSARSEVVILDQASPEFLRQIASQVEGGVRPPSPLPAQGQVGLNGAVAPPQFR